MSSNIVKREPEYDTVDDSKDSLFLTKVENDSKDSLFPSKFEIDRKKWQKPAAKEPITRTGKEYNQPNSNDLYTVDKSPPVSMLRSDLRTFIDENGLQYWNASQFTEFQLIREDILIHTFQATKTAQLYFVRKSRKTEFTFPG